MKSKHIIIGGILIFIIMTFIWGSAVKAQNDPEKVEEAIARLIAEHEADPTAHTGENESLAAHREDEVLDHKPGSVLADKWTMTEMDFSTSFESLAGFSTTGTVTQSFPGIGMSTSGTGSGGQAVLAVPLDSQDIIFYPAKSFLFQFVLKGVVEVNSTALINFGYSTAANARGGVGLSIVNNVAKFYTAKEDGTGGQELNWPTFDGVENVYNVRMQFNAGETAVTVFINGEELGKLDWPISGMSSDLAGIKITLRRSSTYQPYLGILSMFWSNAL
jgi:hypothetical protein